MITTEHIIYIHKIRSVLSNIYCRIKKTTRTIAYNMSIENANSKYHNRIHLSLTINEIYLFFFIRVSK